MNIQVAIPQWGVSLIVTTKNAAKCTINKVFYFTLTIAVEIDHRNTQEGVTPQESSETVHIELQIAHKPQFGHLQSHWTQGMSQPLT